MRLQIPTGSWAVIVRHVRDYESAGQIIKCNISEDQAKRLVKLYNNDSAGSWNYWAINTDEYHMGRYES